MSGGCPVGACGHSGAEFVGGEESTVESAVDEAVLGALEESADGALGGEAVGLVKCGSAHAVELAEVEAWGDGGVVAGAAHRGVPLLTVGAGDGVGHHYEDWGGAVVPAQLEEAAYVVGFWCGVAFGKCDFEGVGSGAELHHHGGEGLGSPVG